jgi:RHS repeat-associated protein
MTYNANLQPVELQRGTLVEALGYDELGHVMYHQQQLGDGKALVTRSMYDVKGFLWTNILDGVEVNGQPTSVEYDFTPDPLSRVQTIRHPQGTLQTFVYDSRGNVIQTTLGDYVEKYALDQNNNVTAVTQGGDLVKTTVYDGFDRPVTITRITGNQDDDAETHTYYPEGELNSRALSDPQFGTVLEQSYAQIDEIGRPVRVTITGTTISPKFQFTYASGSSTVAEPLMTTRRSWDTAGYTTGLTDPILTATFHPDGSGRVMQIDRQEDGATYDDYFTYDDLDHRTSQRDNLGTLFLYLSRADGSLMDVTNALGHVTAYDHSVLTELLDARRQDGMELEFQHDPERQPSYNGDPSAGFHYAYDGDLRMTSSTLRNPAAVTAYGNFDPRNMPQTLNLPGGGTATMLYDLQRRMTDKTVTYLSTAYKVHKTYDALDRTRVVTYQQDSGAVNTATYTYDEAGPLLSVRFQEDAGDFTVHYAYYADGTRNFITYPSGVTVTEQRDSSGRLTGVSDANGNIIKTVSWQGNKQPKMVQLGTTMQVVNTYDVRGRVTGRRVARLSDGAVLAHLRYQYDGANNQQIRQFVHRNGKADNLFYDTGERLSEARVGTVPITPSGFAPPLYDRFYNYHLSGLDYLTSTTTTNLTPNIPVFATNWPSHDAFLLPVIVDDYNRGQADPMGNVTNALLQVRPAGGPGTTPVSATLTNNGNGCLVSIMRLDGLTEENFFQPNGLRYERRVSQGGQVLDFRHFVYDDQGRLLEEYEQTNGTPSLIGRYYYATADAPEAADLIDPATGGLGRYYFLKDNMQSVVAVADTNGVVVERAWYDPFGQPAIEQRDTAGPKLQSVIDGGANSLLIALSESVWTPANDPGPGGGIVPFPPLPTNAVTVSVLSSNIPGSLQWLPSLPGFAPYSVVRFTPSQPLPGIPPAGFVAWWPGSGSAQDVQGGHNGTLEGGATFGPGLIGQAFALNGTSAFVEVPDSPALNFGTNDFTACLWVNFNKTAGEQVLIEKWVGAPAAGWSLIKLPNNSLRLALGDGLGGEVDVDSSVLALPATNWVHYAVRRQNNQFAIFTNGVSVASGTDSANLNAAAPLLFGSRSGTSFFLNGGIDEITLYSRALSAAELTAVAGGVSDPGPVTITLNPGTLADEWGNTNATAAVSFQVYSQTGLVYYTAEPFPQTAATPLARSSVGSPFLFHGQYFDYDTGLVYLRARFYDPYSGMFFEPDPIGYEESVNLYAGLKNNPVGFRDPTGLAGEKIIKAFEEVVNVEGGAVRAGQGIERELPTGVRATEGLVTKANEAASVAKAADEVIHATAVVEGPSKEIILGINKKLAQSSELGEYTIEATAARRLASLAEQGRGNVTVTHFMTDGEGYLRRVKQAAQEAAKGETLITVNVEGFAGGTAYEKISSAIQRGFKGYLSKENNFENYLKIEGEAIGAGMKGMGASSEFIQSAKPLGLSFDRAFSLSEEAGTKTIAMDLGGGFSSAAQFSRTDVEMFLLYKYGALKQVRFVEGLLGETELVNPFLSKIP